MCWGVGEGGGLGGEAWATTNAKGAGLYSSFVQAATGPSTTLTLRGHTFQHGAFRLQLLGTFVVAGKPGTTVGSPMGCKRVPSFPHEQRANETNANRVPFRQDNTSHSLRQAQARPRAQAPGPTDLRARNTSNTSVPTNVRVDMTITMATRVARMLYVAVPSATAAL